MNSNPIIDSVKQFLSQGDTGQALQVLLNFLEKDGSRPEALRALRVVEANYNAARQQEIKGILEFSEARREYAKSNDAILSTLEDLISGQKTSATSSHNDTGSNKNTRLTWLIGGGILLLLGIAGGLYFTGNKEPKPDQNQNAVGVTLDCPKFRSDGFKVLVLEFQKLSGEDSKPELGIQTRIRDLTERNNVNTDVRILASKAFEGTTPGNAEATELSKECQADMVIWGQYEKSENAIVVDIRYAFTDPKWPPGAAMETFKNVSEIKTDQMKTNNLDEAVFRICTAMALHQNKMDLAEKWLNKIQQPNAREIQWKKLLKAN